MAFVRLMIVPGLRWRLRSWISLLFCVCWNLVSGVMYRLGSFIIGALVGGEINSGVKSASLCALEIDTL